MPGELEDWRLIVDRLCLEMASAATVINAEADRIASDCPDVDQDSLADLHQAARRVSQIARRLKQIGKD